MKNNSLIFAKPPSESISLENCEFYHIQDIPGLSEPPKGSFDLRKGVNEYLGHTDFKNKTVLELGPASGFLTFHIEKIGGDVTSIDIDPQNNKWWDIVPNCVHNEYFAPLSFDEGKKNILDEIKKNQNAYWYAHKAFNSKSKLIHSHVNDLPAELGIYDISLMCSVLMHIQNPFLGMKNILRHTKEKVIITEVGGYKRIKSFHNIIRNLIRKTMLPPEVPSMTYLPRQGKKPFVWWKLSPKIISNMASTLGFEKNTVTYHKQTVDGHNIFFFTAVCERTVPMENCNYD